MASTPEKEPTLDASVLDQLASFATCDSNIVARVIAAFLESSESVTRQLCDAIAAGDYVCAARAAHTVKSSSAQVGGTRLNTLVKEFEVALGEQDTIEIERLLPVYERELAELREALAVLPTATD